MLNDGETRSFSSATEFGNLLQSVTDPSSGMAYLNFTNAGNIAVLSSEITGNITLTKTGGGVIRLAHDYGSTPPFSGPVYLKEGCLYLYHGSELGSGTIHLQGGTLSNGGDNWGSGGRTANIDNDVQLGENTTSGIRFAMNYGMGGSANFYGDWSGSGNLILGNATTWTENQPADLHFYGEHTYTGTVQFNFNPDLNFVPTYYLHGFSGLGTGSWEVLQSNKINFMKDKNENVLNRTSTPKSISVANGKTLTLLNDGGGDVAITTSTSGDGMIDLAGENLHLRTVNSAVKYLKIGAKSSLTLDIQNELNAYPTISGAGDLYKTGAGAWKFAGCDFTGITGNVYLQQGSFYLQTGQELKNVGTIYLGGGDESKGEVAARLSNAGRFADNMDIPNNIVLQADTTSYIRMYGSGTETKFRGSITGSGDVVLGANSATYAETYPSVLSFYGDNGYTGNTTLAHTTNVAQFRVYGKQAFRNRRIDC